MKLYQIEDTLEGGLIISLLLLLVLPVYLMWRIGVWFLDADSPD